MKNCKNCGIELEDNAQVCTACGTAQDAPLGEQTVAVEAPVAQTPATGEETPVAQAPAKKKKKGLGIALVAAAVVVVLGLATLVGYFTNWFGLYSPIDKLALAFKNTLTAQSFTATVDVEDMDKIEVRTAVDKEGKNLTLLADVGGTTYFANDGKYYEYREGGDWYYDITYDNNKAFEIYEKATAEETDWDALAQEAEVKEYVNTDKFEGFFTTLYEEYLKNDEWLEETMGYSLEDGVYTFKPETDAFVKDMFALAKEKEIIKNDYKDVIDDVEDDIDRELEYEDIEAIEFSITLDESGDYVAKIEGFVKANGETYDFSVTFSGINKTEITKDEMDKVNQEIKRIDQVIAADKCPTCGRRRWGYDYCYYCQSWCSTCQTYRDTDDMLLYDTCNHCSGKCEGCWNVYTNENLYNYNNQYVYCYYCYLNALNNAYNALY